MGYRNMLELDVEDSGGSHATLAAGGLRLRGLDRRSHGGPRATVAIRPEDFAVGAGGANEIRARVAVVEYRGHELAVEAVAAGEQRLHVLTDERVAPGDEITLGVAPERVLVFDSEAPS
jgi:putative spermidine/putrescine transport system ATP-binding protein